MLRFIVLAAIVATGISLSPHSVGAQVLGRIKEQAAGKLKEKKKAADDRIVSATGEVVDSVAEKSGRGIDSAVTKTSNVLSTAVDRTEQTVVGALKGSAGESALSKQFTAGHVVITDLRFTDDGSVTPASLGSLRALARLMKEGTDTWMVEGHVAAGAGDQVLSDHRAKTVKAALVAEGIDANRVWARGFGSTRSAADGGPPPDRIEIVRMQ